MPPWSDEPTVLTKNLIQGLEVRSDVPIQPEFNEASFTEAERDHLINLVFQHGQNWNLIARQLQKTPKQIEEEWKHGGVAMRAMSYLNYGRIHLQMQNHFENSQQRNIEYGALFQGNMNEQH